MLRNESDSNTFIRADQNSVSGKRLHCSSAVAFQNSKKYAMYMHGVQPTAVVVEDKLMGSTQFDISGVCVGPELLIHSPSDTEFTTTECIKIPGFANCNTFKDVCWYELFLGGDLKIRSRYYRFKR
jgi:hypothetical protein